MKKYLRSVSLMVLSVVIITSCSKNSDTPQTSNGSEFFVSATSAGSYTKTDIQTFATIGGYGSYASMIKYDVDFYKIIYNTTYKGQTIQASGLLAIPKNTPTTPSLLSAQHGTIFRYSDAPSKFPATFTGFELFASTGFVTVIPDFIGYGSSSNISHPYYEQQYSGSAVVDMLKAVKYYLQKQKVAITNRLFLFGYSEGGYVTMAAQKEIETHPENNLTLTAAAEGAGGYDLTGMLDQIANRTTYSNPSLLAFLIKSYDTTYSWNRPYTDFFQEPYASKIPTLLDGTKSIEEIDPALTTNLSALFNPTFYANLKNPTAETTFKQKLADNSFLNWVPKSPTRLYHGTADTTVFYQTSVTTYNNFKAAGATNVELISIPNGTHSTSLVPMITDALPWIQSLDK